MVASVTGVSIGNTGTPRGCAHCTTVSVIYERDDWVRRFVGMRFSLIWTLAMGLLIFFK